MEVSVLLILPLSRFFCVLLDYDLDIFFLFSPQVQLVRVFFNALYFMLGFHIK
jgi:hypothetical protein